MEIHLKIDSCILELIQCQPQINRNKLAWLYLAVSTGLPIDDLCFSNRCAPLANAIRKTIEETQQQTNNVIPPRKAVKPIPHPTIEEIKSYIQEKNLKVDADAFFAYYEANGWRIGRNPMKDWHAALAYWNVNQKNNGKEANRTDTAAVRQDKVAKYFAEFNKSEEGELTPAKIWEQPKSLD